MKDSSYQLIVAGGGVAGTCAAISAARSGIRTILVERESYLGGTGYAGMFQYVCGLYLNGDNFPETTLNSGLPNEIALLLQKASPDSAVRKSGQLYLLPYRSRILKDILTTLSEAEKHLMVLLESSVASVDLDRDAIRSVTVNGPAGEQVLSSTMVIDCTGSGAVAAMAGAGYELSSEDERQMAGFTVRVTGLKGTDDLLPIKVPYFCAQGVKQGVLPPLMRFTTFTKGDDDSEGFCKLSLDGADGAERDNRAQKMAKEMLACLRRSLPAFKEARIDGASFKVLDREGRRITGAYTLTEDDVLSARKFHDGIVKNSWPIELWDKAKGTVYRYLPRGDYYEIPFRCITVKGFTNLLTAGRCISVSHAALGSTRVMGTCMALGEQAGLAAAYHIRNGKYPGNMV
jgi:hypothetical protein